MRLPATSRLGATLALAAATCLPSWALEVERIDLGEGGEGSGQLQAYNLQEAPGWRVFARSEAGFKRSQVWLQRRSAGGAWAAAEALPFADPRWRDSDPQLSADGRRLTFISDRPAAGAEAALGQLDLFEAVLDDGGQWSAPRRLAEAWQSPGYELGPERWGDWLYLASYRAGGPGPLSVYRVRADAPGSTPQPLPAPVNDSGQNSDFTLSPDGRYALWWSSRDTPGGQGGDLYLAERVGSGFGSALRLPAPVNGPGFEFTPSVSADGQWLYFASTRDGGEAGLSHVYRVSWPGLLQALGPQAEAHSQQQLDERVATLWRAIGHGPGEGSDAQALSALLHPQAHVFGQAFKGGELGLRHWSGAEFLKAMQAPGPEALHECEVVREQRRYGAHAQVYSVVETHRDAARTKAEYTGVNSMQWQLGPEGWQLLSLHYALPLPGQAAPPVPGGATGRCLG